MVKTNVIKNMRNETERRMETLNILYRLRENEYSGDYDAVKELIRIMNIYVVEGQDQTIDIPFPEKEKRIVGKLFINKKKENLVKLTKL